MYQSVPHKHLLLKLVVMKPSVCTDIYIMDGLWQRTRHRKTSLEHSSELQAGISGHLKDTSFGVWLPFGLCRNDPAIEVEVYCMTVSLLHLV